MVGLAFDVDAGTDVAQLPDALFRRAIVFSLWEMSKLPGWLERCAAARPSVVAEVLAPAIEIDFNAPTEPNEKLGHLLHKLPDEPLPVRVVCAPQLARLLITGDPPRSSVVELVLKTLEGTATLANSDLLGLARTRTAASESDHARLSIWWRELVLQAPLEAVEYLGAVAARDEQPGTLLEKVLDDLADEFDRRSGRGLEQLRRDPIALAKLAELVDLHVPRIADVDIGQVGSHSSAQDLRGRLSNWLAAIDDPKATVELRRLAGRAALPEAERDWLRHLAELRTVADVSKPMPLDALVNFLNASILEPNTARELFAIAKNRLDDVQHGLAHSDFSVRLAFNPTTGSVLEEPVQNFLAKDLEDNRRGQYSVVREPEVARKKKPDIRLLNPRCTGPVTVEIKIAQKWTVQKLEEGLSAQLVEQYMKANVSNYGIYVVCSSGPEDLWTTPEGDTIDFSGLISRLSAQARLLLEQTQWIEGLEVVPIDFH